MAFQRVVIAVAVLALTFSGISKTAIADPPAATPPTTLTTEATTTQASATQSSLDRSSIVLPEEMVDANHWVDRRVAAFIGGTHASPSSIVHGISQGWGPFERGWSVNHLPLTLNGNVFDHGFGSHANAVISVALPADATHFSALCGIDDTAEARAAQHGAKFTVEADGKEVFQSAEQQADKPPAAIDLDVRGVHELTLKATATGKFEYTPCDWTDVKLTRGNGDVTLLGERLDLAGDLGGCFNFTYDGKPAAQLLAGWTFKAEPLPEESDRVGQRFTERFTWTDPATGLQTVVEMKQYRKYPVVEWTQRFKNTGTQPTPILEQIKSMDIRLPADDAIVLHHNMGDYAATDSYQPFDTKLTTDTPLHFTPNGGRPTDHAWPYYHFEQPRQNRGAMAVIAWPGQWSADITRDTVDGGAVHVQGGQELTHIRLLPGEEIRTPLSVVVFYRGDQWHGQNLWRRWMLDCNVPRPDGELPKAIHAAALGLRQSEKSETDGIHLFEDQHAGLTHWWMDAGWYPCPNEDAGWWSGVGTWDPDPERWPHGIRPVSDLAHSTGLKTILWFEPERVHKDTWIWKNHPEFLLINKELPDDRLLDLGNPDAWKYIVDKVDSQLVAQGIDVYRSDFNVEPLGFWRAHDAADRQGMTEMRHVEGYLAFWDELHRRHPNLLIDTCASGGRRLDLETLRRSVSLWRCDDNEKPIDEQCHTYGIAQWVPYYGSGVGCDDSYTIRGAMLPFISFGMPSRNQPMNWDLYRRETAIWQRFRDDLLGDYYPLTPYSLNDTDWIGWQFDRPENGSGVVELFRREKSPFTAARFRLKGLDPDAQYLIQNVDRNSAEQPRSGRSIMDEGVDVQLADCPSAAIVEYHKQ